MAVPLSELATIIRSKNAGPFRLTFDIMLPDRESYERVKASGLDRPGRVSIVLGVPLERIASIHDVPAANALKITLLRPGQCRFGEKDVYGCQQHAPFMSVIID